MKKVLVIAAIAVTSAIVYKTFYATQMNDKASQVEASNVQSETVQAEAQMEPEAKQSTVAESKKDPALVREEMLAKLPLKKVGVAPRIENISEEVKADVHSTPRSLENFAAGLAPLITTALSNEKFALRLVNESLGPCSRDEGTVGSARTYCAYTARRIAQKHGSKDLLAAADNIYKKLPNNLKAISAAVDYHSR